MSSTKNTGSGSAGPSKAGTKGKGKAGDRTPKQSNIETKANVRDAIGGIEIEMDGGWMPAVYLDEIRDRVVQDTNAQGSYDHPPAKGNHALDVTAFHADHKPWGEARDQRPKILFEYKRLGREDPDYEVGIWMDNGKLVLGPDSLPIRDFRDIPKLCSSQMEGFRMEAISRLDSRIAISDFRARMMRDGLPGANAISMRKTRFRNRGRCLAWDRRAGSDFYEVQLRDEMTAAMIDRNSTEDLEDLTSARTEKLQLDTAGKAPARSGKRALPEDVRALRFKTAREKNQKKLEAEAKLKQENTEQKSGSLESTSNTANNVVSVTKRKRTTESRLVESLRGYVDGLLEEKRPNKKRRTQESSSGSPVLNAKKRKRTGGQQADSNDEAADEGRIFKRGRQSNPLDLLPSAFSLTTAGSSLPPPERNSRAANIASFGRQTGPSGLQDAAAGARNEEPFLRGDNSLGSGDVNEDIGDRNMLPISPLEQARVQNALAVTRHHYEFVTGLRAPETNPRDSYISQYTLLQHHFNQIWSQTGIENPPALMGLSWWFLGSLRWNQSTDAFLNSYGARGRRLFNELENELRGGLLDMFNQHAPRADMVQDWSNLSPTNDANAAASQPLLNDDALPAFDPPAAFQSFAEPQPAVDFDAFAGIDPSLLSGPFPVDQRLGTAAGNSDNPSTNSESASRQDAEDIEFARLLKSAIAELSDPVSPSVPARQAVDQPANPTSDDPFFGDASAPDNSSFDDRLSPEPQGPQANLLQPSPLEQAVRPEDLHTTGVAEDFEMFTQGSDFWLS